jgi:hypothetical protein
MDETTTPATPPKRPLRVAAQELPAHVLAGVKALRKWDDLFDVTDDELAAAVADVKSIRIS